MIRTLFILWVAFWGLIIGGTAGTLIGNLVFGQGTGFPVVLGWITGIALAVSTALAVAAVLIPRR